MLDRHHGWNSSFKPPFIAFVLSLLLAAAMYRFVTKHHLEGLSLTLTLFVLGLVQALIQLVFFLHLGVESKPHWNSITFLFTVLVVIIIVGGSLWIMNNLNYNLMPMEMHGCP
ncbi:MAG TPA: cytochrome o ubiquinol oxidase subunit IV [Rhabdochlamydiaceae bacterium]|jgi:cytochrome o ubiquinol oxidase operon protein cyoD